MAYPVPEDNGGLAVATGQASIDVSFMATINTNDILFVDLLDADNDTFTAPGSWAKVPNSELTNASLSVVKMWLRATGSESGTQTFTSASSSGNTIAGIMSRISLCKTTGTPFEDPKGSGITQNTNPIASEITTTGIERLLLNAASIEDDSTITGGASGYTLFFNLASTVGDDCRVASQYQQVATAQTITQQTSTIAVSEFWGTSTIALLPISTVDDLTATNIVSGAVDVDTPTIGQEHALTSNNIETQNVVIGTPTLSESHILTSTDIETQSPIIENATVGQIHALISNNVETQSPLIQDTTLAQIHELLSSIIESQAVVIGTPTLAEISNVDNLVATDIETAAPIIQLAVLGQIHDILTNDITSGNPIISNPLLDETDYRPFIKRKVCGNKITATFTPKIIRKRCSPLTGTAINPLIATNVISGNPVVGIPNIGQVHNIITDNIVSENPLIQNPELGEEGGIPTDGLIVLREGGSILNTAPGFEGVYDGTLNGSPNPSLTTGINGEADGAYNFVSANSQFISSSENITEIAGIEKMTYSAWMKKTTGNDLSVSTFVNNLSNGEFIRWFTNDAIFVSVRSPGSATRNKSSDATALLGTWVNIIMVFDGSLVGDNRVKMYVNNNEVGTGSGSGTFPAITAPARDLELGALLSASFGDGQIAQVLIYDRDIASAERTQIFEQKTI